MSDQQTEGREIEDTRGITGLTIGEANFLRIDRDQRQAAKLGQHLANQVRKSPEVIALLARADEYESQRLAVAADAQKLVAACENNYLPWNPAAGNNLCDELRRALDDLRAPWGLINCGNFNEIQRFVNDLDDRRAANMSAPWLPVLKSKVDNLGQVARGGPAMIETMKAALAKYFARLNNGQQVVNHEAARIENRPDQGE